MSEDQSLKQSTIASYSEMLELARKHNVIKCVEHDALLNTIVLIDGTRYSYRADNGMYQSSAPKTKEEKGNEES